MKVGFDAKRAFHNTSGLGNYSRNTLNALQKYCPEINLCLFTPKSSDLYTNTEKAELIQPAYKTKMMQAYWRTNSIVKDIRKSGIEIYHGLSNELPSNIKKTNIPAIVSIHDLIFVRHPELYSLIDREIYLRKTKQACKNSDKIIAVSEQTKSDIVEFYEIEPSKIEVIYQNCNPRFLNKCSKEEKEKTLLKYSLPKDYILFVGSIEERKNALNIVKALKQYNIDLPLVLIGKHTAYADIIRKYVNENKLNNQVFILHNIPDLDLPSLYQSALVFVYPSIFEGFGIPVLEAISSEIPVITSNTSSLPEAAGKDNILINPKDIDALANAIMNLANSEELRKDIAEKSLQYAEKFKPENMALQLKNLYQSLL
ncbi:MAG: glycosyltransferase family 4 protein [Bacteroidales bacterium]|nr:glycosyltransferase family 4 protein [Bacteroidales bacterium]